MKYTPKPWTFLVTGFPGRATVTQIHGLDGIQVANLTGNDTAGNARLIAAAPDLLEALKRLHRYVHDSVGIGDDRPSLQEIDEMCCIALTKAEGK